MLRNTELYAKCAPPYLPRAPAVWGLQKLLLAKLSQLRNAVLTSTAGLPPSLRERLRENLLSVRAFVARRLAKDVLGAVFIARDMTIRHIRHCAAPHVAGPLSPRGQLTPAPCIQL